MSMLYLSLIFVFFFFKQKTAYEMRISDWSSDVCSSDLFDMYLQDRAGKGRAELAQAMGQLLGKASQDPALTAVRPNTLADAPQLKLEVDRIQAQAMGLEVGDIYRAIQLMLAPVYVNDFVDAGRVKRVTMQADTGFRNGRSEEPTSELQS